MIIQRGAASSCIDDAFDPHSHPTRNQLAAHGVEAGEPGGTGGDTPPMFSFEDPHGQQLPCRQNTPGMSHTTKPPTQLGPLDHTFTSSLDAADAKGWRDLPRHRLDR